MNGVKGGAGAEGDMRAWTIGLINESGHYLTAESFGCKINASATSMKKKQLWVLEHVSKDKDDMEMVYLKSNNKKYLTCDSKGNAKCDEPSRTDDALFVVVYCPVTGRSAFRSKNHGLHFGGQEDFLKFDTKVEWWTVRFAIHPHINLRNISRKKYAFLNAEEEKIFVSKVIPWGAESLISIEFLEKEGKYVLRALNNKYMDYDGGLNVNPSPNCLYSIELKGAGLALKAADGKYLIPDGTVGELKCKAKGKGKGGGSAKDEIFTLEDSHAQVYITSHTGRKVSTKQGVDLSANQEELTDKEIFQVEYDREEKGWRLCTVEEKYWSLEDAQGIQARSATRGKNGIFYIDWQPSGKVTIKASNQKYVTAKMNGSLLATQCDPSDKEMFSVVIINRPFLILRSTFGFVGMKSQTSTRVECNKSTYDPLTVELSDTDGFYKIKGPNGKFLTMEDGCLSASSTEERLFVLEMSSQSHLKIRDQSGCYLVGEANGTMKFVGDGKFTEWEY